MSNETITQRNRDELAQAFPQVVFAEGTYKAFDEHHNTYAIRGVWPDGEVGTILAQGRKYVLLADGELPSVYAYLGQHGGAKGEPRPHEC